LRRIEKLLAARVSESVLEIRRQKILEWESMEDLGFSKSGVVRMKLDSTLNMTTNFGRSAKGTPAKAIIPTAKGVSITIFGDIFEAGLIDILLKKPQPVSAEKKSKLNGAEAKIINARIGTHTEHYVAFISNVMDILDKHQMQRHYMVMDNAPIDTPSAVKNLTESKGHEIINLPPCSPSLNAIEELWSMVKIEY
jgi:hypothetical protein